MKFKFPNLDSIRTIAFISTFFAHCFSTENAEVVNSLAYKLLLKLMPFFEFGVPVFFVLSGYLITYLMYKELDEQSTFSIKNFYVRRVLRIWPVYYLVLLFGFVVFPIFRTHILKVEYFETADPLKYILFLSNFDQIQKGGLPFGVGLGPTWSVGVEEQFYLFWPILFFLFSGRKFLGVIVSVLIFSILFSQYFGLHHRHTISCLIYLSSGALFANIAFYAPKVKEFLISISSFVFTLILISLFFLMSFHFENKFLCIIKIIIIPLLIGFVILYQCFSGKVKFQKIPYFEKLGKYTYGLYLYHSICIFFVSVFWEKIFKFDDSVIRVIVIKPFISLVLSVMVSYISYNYMEKYFLKLKDKFSS